ncbi:MAG: aldehyde ferredoxin oxidoreductase [Candidatus Lokiarchaeota archaeon]|nr:aldehyde ferredoxin oxidoreductase [Candidatus Lokiarchaeota archaeon]
MFGWFKKYLEIDLTRETIKEGSINQEILEEYIGGRGLGVKIFTDRIKANVEPLDPKNLLIITVGPLTATSVPTSGRFHLTTKSPLTETLFESNSGGFWGYEFKKCGYMALIIKGKAKSPVYIRIDNTSVEILSAEKIWSLNVKKTDEILKSKEEKRFRSLIIGPSGENIVKIASIMNDCHRAFGRGGVGAVMGSKNLKAILVKGDKKVQVNNQESLKIYVKTAKDKIIEAPITSQGLSEFGTSVLVNVINEFGLFPIENHQKGHDERCKQISGERLKQQFFVKKEACYGCPIACGRKTKTDLMSGKGPEYESLWALGPECGIFDLEYITNANYYCNLLGLDTISTGVTIACEMELNQRGLSNSGINFGDKDKLIDIIEKIAKKEDYGTDLAEGSYRLARKRGGKKFAMQVKKMELPAYDPRGAFGHALGYATSNRGACHLRGNMIGIEVLGVPKIVDRFSTMSKGNILKIVQDQAAFIDSLVTCKFMNFSVAMDHMARFMTAVTGVDYSIADLMEVGERIFNLERLYNSKLGFTRKEDTLPERFLKEPLKEGASSGKIVDLELLLDEYYLARGWDENGIPKKDTLKRLNIKKV